MTQTIDLKDAIDQAISSGIPLGGWTVRMTCDDPRFRDPKSDLQGRVLEMFGQRMSDSRFEVIDVAEKGVFAVFDGYHLCEADQLMDAITSFDESLNVILDDYPREDGDRNQVGLNIGFLGQGIDTTEGHSCGDPNCENEDC
jgi:hypothetical protein